MPTPEEILEQLTALSHYLGDPARDLAILGEGNTSARVDDETFYVKASGQQLGTITPNGFCAINFSRALPALEGPDLSDAEVKRLLLECKADDASDVMPSVETFLHAYLLTLPNVHFVGHTHPTAVNAILCSVSAREAIAGRLFPDEIVCCGVAPCYVEYTDPGIPLARHLKCRVEEFYAEYGEWPKTILMQNHGFIAVGKSVKDVQTITAMYVKTARILIGTYALGGPNFLTPENVNRIHTRPDEHYRQRQLGQR
ncbi:MAG TPA: class II aldolase/adducin family protein [Chthonomonadaceae bacterium]|nr:class II aldolase/adducin family protein [Chthonomonadaceae bacterium]